MFFDVCSLHVEFHLYLQAHVVSERDFLNSRTKKKISGKKTSLSRSQLLDDKSLIFTKHTKKIPDPQNQGTEHKKSEGGRLGGVPALPVMGSWLYVFGFSWRGGGGCNHVPMFS